MGHGLGGGDGQLNWSISINSDKKKCESFHTKI